MLAQLSPCVLTLVSSMDLCSHSPVVVVVLVRPVVNPNDGFACGCVLAKPDPFEEALLELVGLLATCAAMSQQARKIACVVVCSIR